MQSYEEKIFIRCLDPDTDEVYMSEMIADNAFEYKGFRFFVNGGRVSDALCGMAIFTVQTEGMMYYEMVELAKLRIESKFKEYLNAAKQRKRANWVRKTEGHQSTEPHSNVVAEAEEG